MLKFNSFAHSDKNVNAKQNQKNHDFFVTTQKPLFKIDEKKPSFHRSDFEEKV